MTTTGYHGDATLRTRFIEQIDWHKAQDAIAQGSYGQLNGHWKGCAVACSLRSLDIADGIAVEGRETFDSHAKLAERLGVPLQLAYLEDRIFEGLPKGAATDWPGRFARAIPVGADLSFAWPRFAIWLLTDEKYGVLQYAKTDRGRDSIEGVSKAYWRVLSGDAPTTAEWDELRRNAVAYAAYAADAAAHAAADAAHAVAYAAYAAAYAADVAYDVYAAADAAYAADAARSKWFVAAADKLVEIMEGCGQPETVGV